MRRKLSPSARSIYYFLIQKKKYVGSIMDLEAATGVSQKSAYRAVDFLIKNKYLDVFLTPSGIKKVFVPKATVTDRLSNFAVKLFSYLDLKKEFVGTFPQLQKKLNMSKDSLKRAARELMTYRVLEISCGNNINTYIFKLNKIMSYYDYIH